MMLLTGGGTGGHLSIVRSLKNELNSRGIKPVFIGSSNGQDRTWFENEEGFEAVYFFDTKGVVNKNKIGKIISLSNILFYSFKTYFIFKKHSIKKIVSVGGYSAAAASFAAVLFKKELFIHEQNAKMGTLNQKLKPYAKAIFSSYLEDSPIKDYPVSKEFFEKKRIRTNLKTVIFLGGSQGASAINNLAKNIAKKLIDNNIKIIHQCGKKEYKELKEYYKANKLDIELYDFINDMPATLQKADLAISRSGASTLWELCANALPAIFIPYPYAAGDHQYYNAKFLENINLCYIIREDELTDKRLIESIFSINLRNISDKLQATISPDGSKKIIDYIITPQSPHF